MPVLSILLPAYNEQSNIVEALRANLEAASAVGEAFEIVAVNDGSADATAQLLDGVAAAQPAVRVFHHTINRGFGEALRTALRHAHGDYCIVAPADSPLSEALLSRYLAAARHADIVLGYRTSRPGYTPLMRFNTWLYHMLFRLVCGLRYRDLNWIHMYRRSIFDAIDIEYGGIVMAAEIVLKARRAGCRIVEIESPMRMRAEGQASAGRFKVMWRTLKDMLALLWRYASGRL
jgi:glycosyltransferase involved in cell wall biosynthesis